MATANITAADITLDDLLEAINPQPPTMDERIQHALSMVTQYHQEGKISDADAEAIIKVLLDLKTNLEVNLMIAEVFTPKNRRRGRDSSRHWFSLL